MLKSVSICAALLLAAAVFADSAEARPGFGGARMGGMHGFSGARFAGPGRMGIAGARFAGPGRMGLAGARFAGPGRMGIAGARFAGPGRMGIAGARFAGPGQVAWAGRGNWSGGRWAGNWRGGHWRGGRWWPWWGVGTGLALAATWPYYGGYGYGYDSCVQWVPDYGWVNVCSYPYGGYYY
jgi:hypothetical protein